MDAERADEREPESLRGRTFRNRSLRESRFVECDLGDVVVRGSEVAGMEVDSPWLLEGGSRLLVNGVDVVPLVDAELNRRFPGRELRTAETPEAVREAWVALERTWSATVARAAGMPPGTVDASVDGEWSFAQTLRHLLMATDTWLGRAVLEQEQRARVGAGWAAYRPWRRNHDDRSPGMADVRPVVAISGYREAMASYRVWSQEAALLPWSYVRAVRAAGGEPVVLPPGGKPDILCRLDGLVLSGGIDLDARRFGEEPHVANDAPQPERDESELHLLAAALERELPVLGVCRGMQLMALAHGGRLIQHLPDVLGTTVHQEQAGAFRNHDVDVLPGTVLADVYGAGRRDVSTHHHQGVADPGSLAVAARAQDGVIEAVEDRERPFVVGVQWHPEVLDDGQLFARFVAEAATHQRPRRRAHVGTCHKGGAVRSSGSDTPGDTP